LFSSKISIKEAIRRKFKGRNRIESFVPKALIGKFPIGIESSIIPLLFLYSKREFAVSNIKFKAKMEPNSIT